MATPEKAVKAKVKAVLESEGVYYFMPPANGFGRSGVPDIVACVNGLFLGIECKANGNKPTALQIREIEAIRRSNGVAVVVDETNWDMVRDMVRRLKATIISPAPDAKA
jgi:Holliday junction resolvase